MITRRDAIEIVNNLQNGRRLDLENQIGSKLYKQFCLMGFITQGVSFLDSASVATWKITELGKKSYDFYKAPTAEERALGVFCKSIGF